MRDAIERFLGPDQAHREVEQADPCEKECRVIPRDTWRLPAARDSGNGDNLIGARVRPASAAAPYSPLVRMARRLPQMA